MNEIPEIPRGLPGSLGQAVFRLIRERGLVGRSESDALDAEWKAVVGPELGRRSAARWNSGSGGNEQCCIAGAARFSA